MIIGLVFALAAVLLVPRLLTLIAGAFIWLVVLAMIVLVGGPILAAVIGISSI